MKDDGVSIVKKKLDNLIFFSSRIKIGNCCIVVLIIVLDHARKLKDE